MTLTDMLSLQCTIFALILIGALLKKAGIINTEGKKCLTDMCVNLIIPCNIFKSFISGLDRSILLDSIGLLGVGIIMEILVLVLNTFVFNMMTGEKKKILKYATLVPNSGFMGNAIAEGLFGDLGVLYTSIFLIPMRIVMWSFGTGYFILNGKTDKKKVIKNILTHPCLVSVYLGIICMLTGIQLPSILVSTVKYCSSCTVALTMLIVGTILADIAPHKLLDVSCFLFSVFRLLLLPGICLLTGRLLGVAGTSLGVGVLMTGMPAGATTAIFAARYDSDGEYATKVVVLTTLLSMITLPIWCAVLG